MATESNTFPDSLDSVTSVSSGLTISSGVLTNDLLTGKAGSQTAIGGTASGESLTLQSTAHATRGFVYFGSAHTSGYYEPSDMLQLGGTDSTLAAGTVLYVDPTRTIASSASAIWEAIRLRGNTVTLSGNTNITTAGGFNAVHLANPNITSASAITITYAATLTVLGAPTPLGSTTITNAYALWLQGGALSRVDGTVQIIGTGSYVAPTTTAPTLLLENNGSTKLVLRNTDVVKEGYIFMDTSNGVMQIGTTGAPLWLLGANQRQLILTTGAVQFGDAIDMPVGSTTGTKIGTATTQRLGFWNATPVVQPASTGTTTTGFTANASANVVCAESTFTGNTGSTTYTVSDIVKNLKTCGILAA